MRMHARTLLTDLVSHQRGSRHRRVFHHRGIVRARRRRGRRARAAERRSQLLRQRIFDLRWERGRQIGEDIGFDAGAFFHKLHERSLHLLRRADPCSRVLEALRWREGFDPARE